MTASALVSHFEARGVRFAPAGDRLEITAPVGALTDLDRDTLRQNKAEILAALTAPGALHLSDFDFLCAELPEDEREALIERAAIMEHEGGLGREAAEEAAVEDWCRQYRAKKEGQ